MWGKYATYFAQSFYMQIQPNKQIERWKIEYMGGSFGPSNQKTLTWGQITPFVGKKVCGWLFGRLHFPGRESNGELTQKDLAFSWQKLFQLVIELQYHYGLVEGALVSKTNRLGLNLEFCFF